MSSFPLNSVRVQFVFIHEYVGLVCSEVKQVGSNQSCF